MVCWGLFIRVALGGAGMTNTVDWEWANSFLALSIYRAVGLTLGLDLNEVRPVDIFNSDALYAPNYRDRVIFTYEAARTNQLQRTGTTELCSETFDQHAAISDGQFWEINLADFRRFCDVMAWKEIPPEFLPRGNTPVPAAIAPSPETPKQRRARWLDWFGKGERGALQRVYERELLLNHKADRSFIGKEIKKAKREKTELGSASTWTSQFVTGGKRTK